MIAEYGSALAVASAVRMDECVYDEISVIDMRITLSAYQGGDPLKTNTLFAFLVTPTLTVDWTMHDLLLSRFRDADSYVYGDTLAQSFGRVV